MNPTQQRPALVFEMLDHVNSQPDHRSRVKLLASYRCFELNTILQINYRNDIRFDLPPGVPKFQRDNGDPSMSMARTINVVREFAELDIRRTDIKPYLKLKKWIAMLESINEREAEVLILAKDHKLQLKWSNVTRQVVQEALSGIL